VEFFRKATNFPFMSTRKVWYGLSLVLMAISIGSFFVRGLNLAVDFTGGVQVQAAFTNAVNVDALRTGLEGAGFREPQVQILGSSREAAIRLPPQTGQTGDVIRARYALTATLFLIFLYIAVRFHTWRLSLGAILAVLHDPILVLGAFSLWHTSFDLPVVSAMLAVIGYSLNDTVVVFDRIRERFEGSRRLEPVAVLDQSINQTLSRTIMTKVVTLIVVVALYALGGLALKGFSEALIIGILAGTYSSIYISSAIALDCGLKAEHLLATAIKKPVDDLP
jgi:preprotein translocase subunit SecF